MYRDHPHHTHGAAISSPTGKLAPHETLELHELLALKSNALIQMKLILPKIKDPELKQIYLHAIQGTQHAITEIMHLLQHRPHIT